MNITISEYNALVKAVQLLPVGADFETLDPEQQEIILAADAALVNLCRKRREQNKKNCRIYCRTPQE